MAEDRFPLPGSSYEELTKIIQAYGKAGRDASPSDVGSVIGIDPTTVSRNNRFLAEVGIIEGGRTKGVTPEGEQLALALEHQIEDDIKRVWRGLVSENEFLQKILAAVLIRGGMEESALRSHIAYTAGQPKRKGSMTGAGTVVAILTEAGALKEQNGELVADRAAMAADEGVAAISEPPQRRREVIEPPREPGELVVQSKPSVRINIDIRIDATPESIEGLGVRLREMLDDLRNNTPQPVHETEDDQ